MFKIEIPTARILCARIDNIIILWDKIRKWNEFLPEMHGQMEFLATWSGISWYSAYVSNTCELFN